MLLDRESMKSGLSYKIHSFLTLSKNEKGYVKNAKLDLILL